MTPKQRIESKMRTPADETYDGRAVESPSRAAALAIISELSGRCGGDHFFDSIAGEDIRREIVDSIEQIIIAAAKPE